MACSPKKVVVSLDRVKVKAYIKARLDAALYAAAALPVPHANRDRLFSPAEWWVDKEQTERHTLETSAGLTYDDISSVLTLTLYYGVLQK